MAINNDNGTLNNVKIVVPLKYLSNFFKSLEMPLINCKIHFELNWSNDSLTSDYNSNSNANNANPKLKFQIASTKLYAPIVTLSTKYNVNLTKQLNKGFKRSVYWNEYKSKIETKELDNNNITRFPLDASFQGANRLFILTFNNTNGDNKADENSHKKYFLPRVDITNYNVLIDGIFMINQFLIK